MNGKLTRSKALTVAALAGAFITPVASASVPSMAPITFPVDVVSVGTAIAAAGVTVLLIWFGYKIAFGLVKKLLNRLHRAM